MKTRILAWFLMIGVLSISFCDAAIRMVDDDVLAENFDNITKNIGAVPTDWIISKNSGYVGVYQHSDLGSDNVMRIQDYSSGNAGLYACTKVDGDWVDFGNSYAVQFDFRFFLGRSCQMTLLAANSRRGYGTFNKIRAVGNSTDGFTIYDIAGNAAATVDGTGTYNLVYVTDDGAYQLYLDGTEIASGTCTVMPNGNAQAVYMGQNVTADWCDIGYDNFKVGQAYWVAEDCQEIWEMGQGIEADINHDCYVNLIDFDTMNSQWMTNNNPDFSAYNWDIGPVEILDVTPNGSQFDVSLKVSLENNSNRFRAFELTCHTYKPGGSEGVVTIASIFAADIGQTQQLPFTITIPEGGSLGLDFFLKDKKIDAVTGRQYITVPVSTTPLNVQITKPYYRNAIYDTMNVSAIEVLAGENWPITTQAGDTMKIELRDPCDSLVSQVTITNTADFFDPQSMSISSLSPGDYSCTAQLIRNSSVLHEDETVLHVYASSTSEVRVNEYLNFVINGQEFFPIGTFHSPWSTSIGSSCNSSISYGPAYDLVADPSKATMLSTMAANDQYVAMFPHTPELWPHNVSGNPVLATRPLPPADAETIGQRVAQYVNQPGIWSWYMADEPGIHTFLPEYLEALGDTIRQYDPYHPAYISYNNGGAAGTYAAATDALGLHWYPGFTDRGMTHPMTSVVDHMESAKAGVDNKQAIIFSPQLIFYAPNYPDDIRPVSHKESRCMAYLSLVRGAKGIVWFSTGGLNSSLEIRIGMPYLAAELRDLEDVFLAHNEVDVTIGGTGADNFHCLAKEVDNQLYLIVVNASDSSAAAAVTLPSPWNTLTSVSELAANNTTQALSPAGQLNLTIEGYGVRIYTTDSGAPSLVAREAIDQLFANQDAAFLATGNLCYISNGVTVDTSEDYGTMGQARLAVDGYTDYAGECVRSAQNGSWMTITFAAAQSIDTIRVHTGSQGSGPLRDYHLELKVGSSWVAVTSTAQETTNGDYLIREHTFTAATATAIRFTMDANMADAGYVHEIEAFAP